MKKIPHARLYGALALGLCLTAAPGARANDWINPGAGDWNDPANWTPAAVPDNATAWSIGNVNNGGTAVVSNTVPRTSEAWAGNSGAAGSILVTNGGNLRVDNWLVVGRTGTGGNTPMSTLLVTSGGVVNKTGDGFIVGDGTSCTGQVIVTGTGLVDVTGGWIGIGNGAGGVGYLYLKDNAVFNAGGQDWNIGDFNTGRGYGYIQDNATLNVSRFFVGKQNNSLGILEQTGGAIVGGTQNPNEWTIGGDNEDADTINAYGFYNLIAGTFTNPNNFQIGRRGMGVLYQSGGTLSQGSWCSVGRYGSGQGILYVTGGQFIHTGTGQSLMIGEGGSRGEATVGGTGSITTSREFAIGNGGTGYFNLNNGGTLTVPRVARWSGSGYLNFNGGTLKAKVDEASFLGGLTEARIYSGNAIIDTAGFNIGVDQALLGVAGQGVISIPIADGGQGYQGPPLVRIEGDGTGALAIAQVNPVTGTVTNVVVTCPGYNYSSVSSVNFLGGGASMPAIAGTPVLGNVTSGGLVKNGAGTLTLRGANDYTGATVVNGGTLVLNTAVTGGGAITLANDASLGVAVHMAGAQLIAANLTLGNTLNMDLGGFGNPMFAPISTTGTLAVNGAVTVNILDDYPQLGAIPLIQYNTRTGSGSFVLGSLPTGITANIATNDAAKTIDLVITAVAAPRWDGQAGGTWDVGQTLNWVEISTGLPTLFNNGLVATLDDNALGTTSILLNTTVEPAATVVNNTNLAYSISGSGKIAGGGSLTKRGPNSLTLSTVNEYTGPTIIAGGTVNVTNLANGGQPSAIGRSSSAPESLALSGGTLAYSGPATTVNRGYTVQAPASGINNQSDLAISGKVTAGPNSSFVKSGAAKLTYTGTGTNELSGGAFPGYNVLAGTLVFDGSAGPQVNHSQNEFWVSSTVDAPAHMLLTNTTVNIDSWLAVGRGNGSANHQSSLMLQNSSLRSGNFSMGYANNIAGNLAQQTLALNGTSTFTNNGDMNIGESGGSTSTVLLNGNSKLFSNGRAHFGWHDGATANVTIADNASLTVNAWVAIGHEGGVGNFTVKDSANMTVTGDLNVTDVGLGQGNFTLQNNATVNPRSLFVGKGVGSTGIFNQTGGSVVARDQDGEMHVGFHGNGTYNMSAGTLVAHRHWFIVGRWTDGPGVFNVTGGTFTHGTSSPGRLFRVGEDGQGELNISGTGVVESAGNEVTIGWNATGSGTVNLNPGGTFQARRIIGGSGSSTINLNGGVLRAGPNANVNFMSGINILMIQEGGAIIDTGTNRIGINQDIQAIATGTPSLTKRGEGFLGLNGNNFYTGATTVTAGSLGGTGAITGPVSVQAAGALAPGMGVGALTINNTLNLAGTTVMELDATAGTNDQVVGVSTLTYGGTLVVTNANGIPAVGTVYKLFQATTYAGSFSSVVSPGMTLDTSKLAVDGTVTVLSAVASTPVPLQFTASADRKSISVSWPSTHTGWVLQVQTNAPGAGLSSTWYTIPNSGSSTQYTLPVDPAGGSVFMRLAKP